ncbi:endo alpha-1,4 polygalactosaminidase [Aspergillus uvarum CBS 121591]|uniref:alpha-galactosidase n=1 Tax=Aspergillus uvarum CBS 121591 TaxID=1448315 RepID=A0A319CMH0_9EURO|nr:endo alpha-1,4 polygalactosaminidase [Aspergillus uvarum CBS 121591]PYH76688.1 endo alpha-1,4 polygalactosaminidase [Aspergillus uvarum CBS 121591]
MDSAGETALKGYPARGWKAWSLKKKLIVVGSILGAIVVIGVALGVGLGVGLNNGGGGGGGEEEPSPPTNTTGNYTTAKWQPAVGTTWQIELLYTLNDTSVDVDVYDIDLFNNNQSIINSLHDAGRKVICYFSAGSYENWRPDKDDFKSADLGKDLDGWPGEKWINISSPNVRKIMQARLDMAQKKSCDGVDPDNVDGYDNTNGLGLTEADSIDYVNWMANEAHARNMSIGLKNAGAIIPSVIKNMQWSVNEQCAEYDECDTYAAFTKAGKPVFHIEYPKGDDTNNNNDVTTTQKNDACDSTGSGNFSTVIKNMDLDNWIQTC